MRIDIAPALEAAIVACDLEGIIRALMEKQAAPLLRLGERLREAEAQPSLWRERLEWCKAEMAEAKAAFAPVKAEQEAVFTAHGWGVECVTDKGTYQALSRRCTLTESYLPQIERALANAEKHPQIIRLAVSRAVSGHPYSDLLQSVDLEQSQAANVWSYVQNSEGAAGRQIVLPGDTNRKKAA